MLVSIVFYFLLFPIAFAFNVTIYKSADYNIGELSKPVHKVNNTYEFEFYRNNLLKVDLRLKNKPPDVVAKVYVTYGSPTVAHSAYIQNHTISIKCHMEDYCLTITLIEAKPPRKSDFTSIAVGIQFTGGTGACFIGTQIILQGNATSSSLTRKVNDKSSLCLNEQVCTVMIDLQDACQGKGGNIEVTTGNQQLESASPSTSSSKTKIWIYTIPSVVVLSVIILVIYIYVKKIRRENSGETMQLNTYSTNEILYADLSFVNGTSQPPKQEEESPYAEIIGVLRQQ